MRNKVVINKEYINIAEEGIKIPTDEVEKMEVELKVIRKDGTQTFLNALVNAASSSISNGYEKMDIYLSILMKNGDTQKIKMNDKTVVRHNLDYHEIVRSSREVVQSFNKLHR